MNAIERFWNKVRKSDGCWEWQAANVEGYGYVKFDGKTRKATHVSWFLATGSYPRMCMLHRCDNPCCVRPSHLFEGTHADNVADMVAKGRQGSRTKLTAEMKAEIERRFKPLCPVNGLAALGREFGVPPSSIRYLVVLRHRGKDLDYTRQDRPSRMSA